MVAQRSETPRPAGGLSVGQGGIPDGTGFVEYFSERRTVVEQGQLMLPVLEQGATIWLVEGL